MTGTQHRFIIPFSPALALIALVLAAAAQYAHTFHSWRAGPAFFFLAGLAFWMVCLVASPVTVGVRIGESRPVQAQPGGRWSAGFAVAAVVLALLTFFTSTGNRFTPDVVLAWLASIAAFLYAFWEPEKHPDDWHAWLHARWESLRRGVSDGWAIPLRVLLLAAILLVGWFFYFYNLDGVPGEMDSDHAEKILDVNDVVTGDIYPIFFQRNTGREPLQFYLTAWLSEAGQHPIDHMALKLVTATMGWLVIPGTYFVARELFDDDVAFPAAALIAVSKWPVTIARMGLRFPFAPVLLAPMVFFLLRALKHQRRNDFLMMGLFLGAGLFGYNAFRIAPVLVGVLLLIWLAAERGLDRARFTRLATNVVLALSLALIVFTPLFRYSTEHPESFWYRVLTRLANGERALPGDPITTLGGNLVDVALMFNWTGDMAWPNSIPGDPALDPVSGALFLMGGVYAVYRLLRYREWVYALVLAGLATMLLPSALSLAFPEENPSNARAGGAIPFVFIIASLTLSWLARALRRVMPPLAAISLIGLLLATIALFNFVRYFHDFDQSYRQYAWNSSEVAGVIRGFAETIGDYDHAYILSFPHWIDTRNVAINMGKIGWDQTLTDAKEAEAHAMDSRSKLYVLHQDDRDNLTRLQEVFPNGQLRKYRAATARHDFIVWFVPGTLAPDAPIGSK